MNYLNWNEQTITDFSASKINEMYENGYVLTRRGPGVMHQTRSVRIDLDKFELSSENRRILKKTTDMDLIAKPLPLKMNDYDWHLGKMAKDFYDNKFAPGIMSAQKIKEMMTDSKKSNFNILLSFSIKQITQPSPGSGGQSNNPPSQSFGVVNQTPIIKDDQPLTSFPGFAICYANQSIFHYSYPFYDLQSMPKDTGLGMMIRAIQYAQKSGVKYIYLGSLQRPSDTYKLQFSGMEWFDGKSWQTDLGAVKKILTSVNM